MATIKSVIFECDGQPVCENFLVVPSHVFNYGIYALSKQWHIDKANDRHYCPDCWFLMIVEDEIADAD